MAQTFNGGIRLERNKNTASSATTAFTEPAFVAISMSQAGCAPCMPLVAVGDHVDIGQCIGDNRGAPCCPVHASVSGTVRAVETRTGADGAAAVFVVIENDCLHTVTPSLAPVKAPLGSLTAEEIAERVRKAGIADGGGAVSDRLKLSGGAKRLIINCVESEPYVTVNRRLILEQPETVIKGIKVLIYALGTKKAVVAVEDGCKDVIETLDKHITDKSLISVKTLKPKYPQDDERQLIYVLYDKEISAETPVSKQGYAVFTPETAAAVYRALSTGMPFIHKRVTVDGDAVKKPCSLAVPLGVSAREIAEKCCGVKKKLTRIVLGGPMRGRAQSGPDCCVTKDTDAVLFLSDFDYSEEKSACIRCGRCLSACRMRLSPYLIAAYSAKGGFEECARLGVSSCVECGACAYVCPGRVPIVKHVREAKEAIKASRRGAEKQGGVEQ